MNVEKNAWKTGYILITLAQCMPPKTRHVSLVEQELSTLPEHTCSLTGYNGFVYSIFSFMCILCRSLFVLLFLFSFGHRVACPSAIYGL